ncbi:hypothetical protein BH23GEM1_BH23GEM1_09580 [soil metagenome]
MRALRPPCAGWHMQHMHIQHMLVVEAKVMIR